MAWLLLLAAAASPALVSAATLDVWQARAEAAGLARDPVWLALIHHDPGVLGQVRGRRGTTGFYLSPRGHRDADAELRATLAAFFEPEVGVREEAHAQCRYPARFRWIDRNLGLNGENLPEVQCEAFAQWHAGIGGRALTLIFPEAFLGNPASSFGHLLLRFDRDPEDGPGNLASYIVDYTAHTGGEAGPLYLLKGLTGFYPARIGVHPYDLKAKLYRDWENRDIWEYRLDLDPTEIDFLLAHVWELRDAGFPYFFLHRNCAYFLLRMLQAVRPELPLWKRFALYAIPVDVLRASLDLRDPEVAPRVRPSPLRVLRHALAGLDADEHAQVFALASGALAADASTVASLPAARRARVLAIAYDLLRYRFLAGEVEGEATRGRAMALLRAASRTGVRVDLAAEVPARDDLPERAHGTARLGLAGGVREADGFVELAGRFAFHDLVDWQRGQADDAHIDVLAARLRIFAGTGRVRLHELRALDVRSIPPRDALMAPVSWRFQTGLATRLHPESDGDLEPTDVWRSAGGVGLAYDLGSFVRVYGMAEAYLDVGSRLDHDLSLGPGGTLGAYLGNHESRLRMHLAGSGHYFALGERGAWWQALAEPSLALRRDLALRLRGRWERIAEQEALSLTAGFQLYF